MSSLLDSVIYVVSLGDDPSSFFFSRPCGVNCRGAIFIQSSMVTSAAKKIADVTLLGFLHKRM